MQKTNAVDYPQLGSQRESLWSVWRRAFLDRVIYGIFHKYFTRNRVRLYAECHAWQQYSAQHRLLEGYLLLMADGNVRDCDLSSPQLAVSSLTISEGPHSTHLVSIEVDFQGAEPAVYRRHGKFFRRHLQEPNWFVDLAVGRSDSLSVNRDTGVLTGRFGRLNLMLVPPPVRERLKGSFDWGSSSAGKLDDGDQQVIGGQPK